MASGTGNLPNPGMDFTPFDILTAEEMDDLVENIESLADGSGIGDGAIGTSTLGQSVVTAEKTAFGGDYSTSEVNTGFKWVDNKDIYKKTINFGTLPNSATKNVAHGISDLDYFVFSVGYAADGSNMIPIPFPHGTANSVVLYYADKTNLYITTYQNRTAFTTCYITLYYTKT